MIRRSIRLTFGAKAQPGITLQRGDCFSTAICAQCYAPNGCPVSFEGRTVHVVYQTGGQSSPGYEVEARDNVLTWTLPPCAAQTAGPGKMQLMVYGADILLHSAVIPYTVLDSLEPGEGGEDPVPALVLLLDKAQAAISGANAAAQAAAQVAAEVQSRLDSGAFIGPPGLDAPQIDDTQITTTNPWSSMQIVKTLCPPFTVSGSVVQCTPVENSPLDVQVEITPTQEGEGDPSPENVRPIVGWDSVNVLRGGKNLLDWSKVSIYPSPAYGLSFEKKENSIRVFGVSTENGVLSFNIATTTQSELRGKNFVFSWFTSEENVTGVYGLRTPGEAEIAISANLTEGSSYDFTIQIAVGTEKLTAYEPYQGQTYTVQLGRTIYGGTLDVGTGTLTVTQVEIESYNGENLPGQWISDRDIYTPGTQPSIGAQVVYDLAESQTIQLALQQIITLSGTNTLFADAGNITVTGASDPIATITALQNRVSALEGAHTEM